MWNFARWLSRQLNMLTLGDNEMLSTRFHRNECTAAIFTIDFFFYVFFNQEEHCRECYEKEVNDA